MVMQPAGTVTLLFTDIEGSTRLLLELGRETYAEALDLHRRVLRECFDRHGGYEVDSEGDAFFVAFSRAEDAVAAAGEGQRALGATRWPDGAGLLVRMGIHTGEPLAVPPMYVGMDVHRAARIMAAGHGGQVLVSQSTYDLLDERIALRDLGEHRLKDLSRSQRLFQLQMKGLRSEFPALKTLEGRPTNLPVQLTPFIGRGRELEALESRLQRADVRLVTLTGAGGTGKTRLALQAAADLIERFESGVFFVSLATVTDATLVVASVAQTLGLREQPERPLVDTVGEYLRDKAMLLVLDNFEHVVDAAPVLADWLSVAAQLRVLATSRVPLRLAGEHLYDVPPLELPVVGEGADFETLSGCEAVRLFESRARAARKDFSVTSGNVAAVAKVCVRLDGLPLAIELAAARVSVLSPESILSRLDQRLKLLTGGSRDSDPRQRTLRATIEWSFTLLTEHEKSLFARLSVFADGCRIDAAEAVCGSMDELGLDLFDGLASLVEKSLLRQREGAEGEPRFWMLETIREYARERLEQVGERDMIEERHADWALALVARAAEALEGSEALSATRLLVAEQANLRAALDWAAEANRPRALVALVAALAGFWWEAGWLDDSAQWLPVALAEEADGTAARATLLRYLFWLRLTRGDLPSARTLAAERQAIADTLDDDRMRAGALSAFAAIAGHEGDHARHHALQTEAVALARALGPDALAAALVNLGSVSARIGDLQAAREAGEEALALAESADDVLTVALVQSNLAWVSLQQNRLDEAEHRWRIAIPVARETRASLLRDLVEGLAALAALRGDGRRAAVLEAAAARDWADHGDVPDPSVRQEIDHYTRLAREQVGDDEFARAWAEGEQISLLEAAHLGLAQGPPLASS